MARINRQKDEGRSARHAARPAASRVSSSGDDAGRRRALPLAPCHVDGRRAALRGNDAGPGGMTRAFCPPISAPEMVDTSGAPMRVGDNLDTRLARVMMFDTAAVQVNGTVAF